MPAPDPVYAPMALREKLALDPEADAHASTIHREGFVVLRNVLSAAEVAAMRAALDPLPSGAADGSQPPSRDFTPSASTRSSPRTRRFPC